MTNFRIPATYLPGFQAIAQMSEEEAANVIRSLNEVNPGTGPSQVKEIFKLKNIEHYEEIISSLFSLSEAFNHGEAKRQEFVEDLAHAYEHTLKSKSEVEISKEEVGTFRSRIDRFLSPGGFLYHTYKAVRIHLANERNYSSARIITDIRPVFDQDVSDGINRVILNHKLRIQYLSNNEPDQFFVTLDKSDLIDLKAQIERALDKDAEIQLKFSSIVQFINITE